MRLLILGGTVFLGRHIAEAARARGHELTLFNRGKSGPDLFVGVPTLRGDRTTEEGLAALDDGGPWDAVIDTCGYVPRVVRLSAERLAKKAKRYCFISSVSVYKNWPEEPCDEGAALATIEDEATEEVTGQTYGALKALCEKEVHSAFPEAALIVRPGLIVGPHDPTDRFAYWPRRLMQGGPILAPGGPQTPVQFIDVRDLAEWTVRLLEGAKTGVYNADGPPTTFGALLGGAEVVYVSERFLEAQGVAPWIQLPLWIPGLQDKPGGATDCRRALADGLTCRPLEQTLADTQSWLKTRSSEGAWKHVLTSEREAELLAAWSEAAGKGA